MRVIFFIAIFLLLFYLVYLEYFEPEPVKHDAQYVENNISKNYQANSRKFILELIISAGVILSGIFLSCKLINDPCDKDTTPVSGVDGGQLPPMGI